MCSLIFSFLLEYVMRTFSNHDFVGIPFVLEWLLSKSWDKDYKGRYSTSIFLFLIIFIFISIFSARLSNFRIAWNSKPTTHLSLRRPVENHWLSATKNCRDPLWNNFFAMEQHFFAPICFDVNVFIFLSTIKKIGCRNQFLWGYVPMFFSI